MSYVIVLYTELFLKTKKPKLGSVRLIHRYLQKVDALKKIFFFLLFVCV